MQKQMMAGGLDERNRAIWTANQEHGVGTARLARLYGLSRQRIKQIIARQQQLRAISRASDLAEKRGHGEGDDVFRGQR